jgi:hypothetical protein
VAKAAALDELFTSVLSPVARGDPTA